MTTITTTPPIAPATSPPVGVRTSNSATSPRTGSARVTSRLNTLVMPIAALAWAPVNPAWTVIAYCTPTPIAPPAGTALAIVNPAWRIRNAGQ